MSKKSSRPVEVDTSPWLKPGEFPTLENTNPNCPEEALLHTFAGLPGMKGAPLPFPIEYLKEVSRRQWDCGVRPMDSVIPPERKIKYQQPKNTDPHWLTSPGVWVPADAPDRSKFDIKEFVASLPQDTKRQLAEALGFDTNAPLPEDGQIVAGVTGEGKQLKTGPVSRDGAYVTNYPVKDPGWNPALHTVDEVLEYLAAVDDAERERVLMVERHLSKRPRKTILDRFPEVGV
ncbi:phage gene 29 protein family protein [Nocardia flavorosea]|uniref:DUF2744 domain-containing protein n=1 Tax=Nocardia flavorosea TaxID=53429 RepID=A0A846YSS9_9NOCA|nr:DUF2744 domain-containing protein [Nocardia flavorosea]NKY60342.1 DUF2744 domain-containing protein [Nocardia flavorosea]